MQPSLIINNIIRKNQHCRFWKQFEENSKPSDKIAKALLKVVRRHLIPSSSSTNVERFFSYGSLVATDHRASLSGEKLDQILFLRENALMANFNLGWLIVCCVFCCIFMSDWKKWASYNRRTDWWFSQSILWI